MFRVIQEKMLLSFAKNGVTVSYTHLNYGAYGDTGHHLHFHLCPKYKDEFEWGGVFLMNPDKKYLSDAEYAEMIEKIKSHL